MERERGKTTLQPYLALSSEQALFTLRSSNVYLNVNPVTHPWCNTYGVYCVFEPFKSCLSPLNSMGYKLVIIYNLCYWYQWLLSTNLHFFGPGPLFLNLINQQYTRNVPLLLLKNIIYCKLTSSVSRKLDIGLCILIYQICFHQHNQLLMLQYLFSQQCMNLAWIWKVALVWFFLFWGGGAWGGDLWRAINIMHYFYFFQSVCSQENLFMDNRYICICTHWIFLYNV